MAEKSLKLKIEVDGKVIERVPKLTQLGNFQIMTVRYDGMDYIVGDGDEYLRGLDPDKVYELGRGLSK